MERFATGLSVPLPLPADALPDRVEGIRGAWVDLMKALGMTPDAAAVAPGPEAAAPKNPNPNSQQYRTALAQGLAEAVDHLARLKRRSAPAAEVSDSALRLMS